MISFFCAHCGRSLRAPDSFEGLRVRCLRCKAEARVPCPSSEEAPGHRSASAFPIIMGFGGCVGILIVSWLLLGMFRKPDPIIMADGTSAPALRASLDAMRATMGPHRRKRFDEDVITILVWTTNREILQRKIARRPDPASDVDGVELMRWALNGRTMYQIHRLAEECLGRRDPEPF